MANTDLNDTAKMLKATQLFCSSAHSIEKILIDGSLSGEEKDRLQEVAKYVIAMPLNSDTDPSCKGKYDGVDVCTLARVRAVFYRSFLRNTTEETIEYLKAKNTRLDDYLVDFSRRAYDTLSCGGARKSLNIPELELTKRVFDNIADVFFLQVSEHSNV